MNESCSFVRRGDCISTFLTDFFSGFLRVGSIFATSAFGGIPLPNPLGRRDLDAGAALVKPSEIEVSFSDVGSFFW